MARDLARAERTVLLTQLLNGVGFGLVFPVAAYTAESFGVGATVITLMLAVHPLARLVSGPLWGALADHFGRRPVLLAGIAVAAAGHLAFGLADAVPVLFVARMLTGLGTSDAVAAAAILADTTSGAERAGALGRLRAAYGLGMLAGPLLGGATALLGLQVPALVAAALCAGNLVLAAATVPETHGGRAREPLDLGLLRLPNVAPALCVAFAAMLALSLAEAIVALAIEHVLVPRVAWPWDAPVTERALVLTVALIMGWGLTMAFVEGWLAGRLATRHGERRLVLVGLAAWAVAFAVTPAAYLSGVGAGAIVVVATAAAAGLTSTALGGLYSRSLPESAQGSGFGLYQSAAAAGEVLGPAVAGALFEAWFGWPYVAGTVLLLVGLVAAARLRQP